MAARGDSPTFLTDDQKRELAGIDAQYKAKIAEVEILWQARLAAARMDPDNEELKSVPEQYAKEIQRLRTLWEEDKERVRSKKS